MKRLITPTLFVAVAGFASLGTTHATTHDTAQAHAPHHTLADGEVRRVDKETKKVTIRHGAIANLDMPPMTMVFQVKDAALLDSVKAGDKVRFSADKVGGAYVVTQLEQAQ